MNVNVQLTPEGQAALANIVAFPNRLLPALARGLDTGLELALGRVTASRFTGKGAFPVSEHRLGVVTGRLRSSLRRTPAVISGGAITATVGSNVRYFAPHEFGFSGTVQVKAHKRVRLVNSQGKPVSAKAARKSKDVLTGYEGEVRAHSRRVNVPERAPLRTGLSEQGQLIGRALSAEIVKAWRGTGA